MKPTFVKGVVLGAAVSTIMLVASTAFAGSGVGGLFNLGKTNSVNATTELDGSTNGPQLRVLNTSGGAAATGIGIHTAVGKPPLVVSSSTKVKHLNADLLDGLDAGQLQKRVLNSCPSGTAISAINSDGIASCATSRVFPIHENLAANNFLTMIFSPSSLRFHVDCRYGSTVVGFIFENLGGDTATLNWMFSQGGTTSTVNAEGVAVAGSAQEGFALSGNRLEGQFIWAEPNYIVTVNLHVFDAVTGCEYTGTATVGQT